MSVQKFEISIDSQLNESCFRAYSWCSAGPSQSRKERVGICHAVQLSDQVPAQVIDRPTKNCLQTSVGFYLHVSSRSLPNRPDRQRPPLTNLGGNSSCSVFHPFLAHLTFSFDNSPLASREVRVRRGHSIDRPTRPDRHMGQMRSSEVLILLLCRPRSLHKGRAHVTFLINRAYPIAWISPISVLMLVFVPFQAIVTFTSPSPSTVSVLLSVSVFTVSD